MDMKRRSCYPAALVLSAAVMIAGAGVGKAWAYFTTYTEAAGGYTVHLGDRTEITEEFTNWTKHVVITSEEDSEPVYIRIRAFCGSRYTLQYSGEGWSQGADGYYYYGNAVSGGASTASLDLKINNIPEDPEELERFNVVVIYESAPVRYHEDGTPFGVHETDWSILLDNGRTESFGEAEGGGEG